MALFNKGGRHHKETPLWWKILKWSLLSILIIALAVGLAGFIFVYRTLGKIGMDTEVIYAAREQLDIPEPDKPMNVLVLGTDDDPDGDSQRSDTMMLIRINPQGECLSMMSIPRDVLVDTPGLGQDKINSAYATGGVPKAIEAVRELTGVPVHHFVLINYAGFKQAVDAMGGVYIDVDRRYFNDNSYTLPGEEYEPIDIEPGYQKLNGEDALSYVRYRHTDNDFMRIKRQQYFITDVQNQSLRWGNVQKIPELADVFASNTTSDFSRSDVLSMIKFILAVDKSRVYQEQLPIEEVLGGPSGSYILPAEDELEGAVARFEDPEFEQAQTDAPADSPPAEISTDTKNTAIAILNGNGYDGSAAAAAQLLADEGCSSVLVEGNAKQKYMQNMVLFRKGNEQAADEVSTLFEPCDISSMPDDLKTDADVVVVVGEQFKTNVVETAPAAEPVLHFQSDSDQGRLSWKAASQQVPFDLMRPTDFPVEFSYAGSDDDTYSTYFEDIDNFRVYDIETDNGTRSALKVMGRDQFGNIWGITATNYMDAPLLENPTDEKDISGKTFRFYYSGTDLRYLAWQDGDVVYWISNTLQNTLSEDTMVKLAASFKPVERAS